MPGPRYYLPIGGSGFNRKLSLRREKMAGAEAL